MLLAAGAATPAAAQLGGTISFQTDDYFRGYSLSEGRPVATLDLAYDDASGLYLAGAATGVATRHSGVKLLGFSENIGFARKIGTGPVIDVGFTNTNYEEYYSGGTTADYREVYAGLITDHLAAHVHYSPHYFRGGVSTLYVDTDGVLRPFPFWRLTGHFGVLTQLDGPRAPGEPHTHYDWKLGAGRRLGPLDLQLAWTDGSPGPDYYAGEPRHRGTLVFGMSYAF
ncbi:TorF family putative porin [Sphingomonas sp. PR090111-T3T-6A]|uniref:TorF family putative porin n=1 Tax=Sphingomonas sp. PR090111-T3T-6A TaxID=685778 RepID=UPI000379F060|nr:TorF family putative porin [Sphingomonas sp. PR090111-T3T-6A]